MGAAIVLRDHLDIVVVPSAIGLLVLDAEVRKVHLVVEIRQVVLECPIADFFPRPIRVAVVVRTVPVTLV
jgi:hypothetical protein